MSMQAIVTITTFLLTGVLSEGAEDSCLLQVSAKQTIAGEECKLPANGRWCDVKLGAANFKMAVYNTDDIVSQNICQTNTWELTVNDITALGKPGNALDIGANIGFYSFVLAANGWNVTSFEPMTSNHEFLEATMCQNPALKQRIRLNKFGLGSKDDHCIIISGDANLGDGISQCGELAKKPIQAGYHKRASMDIRRLDDVLTEEKIDKIDFVKMDVEGFECQVMAGGQSLLTKYRPRLIQSEVWPQMQGCLPKDYLASYAKAKYSVNQDMGCAVVNMTSGTGSEIVNRYMCPEAQQTGLSLLEVGSVEELQEYQRKIVWLTPDDI